MPEATPAIPQKPKDSSVAVKMSKKENLHWYKDPTSGNIVKLSEADEDERIRQQKDPDSDPAPGYPRYSQSMAFEEIPGAADPIEPPEPIKPAEPIEPIEPPEPIEPVEPIDPPDPIEPPEPIKPADQAQQPLDPSKFKPVRKAIVRKDGTLSERGGALLYWMHPDKPEQEFTQEEVDKARAEKKEKDASEAKVEKAKKAAEAKEGRGGKVFEAGKNDKREIPDAERDWTVHPHEYIGIKTKPMAEIIGSPKDQQLFGELLNVLSPNCGDLLARTQKGDITDKEQQIIVYAQHEFAKGLKQAEEASARLTLSDIELMAKRDPSFFKMVTLHGAPRMLEFFKDDLPHIAMRNRTSVEGLLDAYKNLDDRRKTIRYKHWDTQVRAHLKHAGIDEHDYHTLDTAEGREVMRKKLEEKYRNEASNFGRAVNWVLSNPYVPVFKETHYEEKARKAVHRVEILNQPTGAIQNKWWKPKVIQRIFRGPTGSVMRDVDMHLESITTVLAETVNLSTEKLNERAAKISTMSEGMERRQAVAEYEAMAGRKQVLLIEAFTGNKHPLTSESGPQTPSEVNAQQEKVSTARIQQYFNRDKARYKTADGRGWVDMSTDEKKDYRANVWNSPEIQHEAENAQKTGNGFWATIFRAFFGEYLKKQKEKIALD